MSLGYSSSNSIFTISKVFKSSILILLSGVVFFVYAFEKISLSFLIRYLEWLHPCSVKFILLTFSSFSLYTSILDSIGKSGLAL